MATHGSKRHCGSEQVIALAKGIIMEREEIDEEHAFSASPASMSLYLRRDLCVRTG
jgi:AmiR/NasT family two-component response regulator